MRVLEIEKLFQIEEELNKVLEELKEDINTIDKWATVLRNGLVDNPEETNKAIGELTGAYSNLRTVLSIAISEKTNREVRNYNKLRIETEKSGGKFVSAGAEREASESVANYRRVRNIIEGYKEAAEKDISSLQSMLKDMIKEKSTM